MKKILVISASPRKKGNSDVLCDEFVKGAKEAGNQVEKIFLGDKKIGYCIGCGVCFQNPKNCSQKDDMNEILLKLIKADVIVMSTPVYFYAMNGQMKTFIDRVCSGYTLVSNKEFYFIMTAADRNKKTFATTIEEFRSFLSCLENPAEKGIIYGGGLWEKKDVEGSNYINEAFEMGKNS